MTVKEDKACRSKFIHSLFAYEEDSMNEIAEIM